MEAEERRIREKQDASDRRRMALENHLMALDTHRVEKAKLEKQLRRALGFCSGFGALWKELMSIAKSR